MGHPVGVQIRLDSVDTAVEPGTTIEVGTASTTLVEANPDRSFLMIKPEKSADWSSDPGAHRDARITLRLGDDDVVLDDGPTLFAGIALWREPAGMRVYTGAFQVIGSEPGIPVVVVEL